MSKVVCESNKLRAMRESLAEESAKLLRDYCELNAYLKDLHPDDDYSKEVIRTANDIAEKIGKAVSSLYDGEHMYVADELSVLIKRYGELAARISQIR